MARTLASDLDFARVARALNLPDPRDGGDAVSRAYLESLLVELLERLEEVEIPMTATEQQLRIGQGYGAPGSVGTARMNRDLVAMSVDWSGRFEEATRENLCFCASTPITGVAPGTALTTTPPFLLYNPPNSGRILAIVETFVGYVSGTLGAGSLVYAAPSAAQPNAPTGGTTLAVLSKLLGGADGQSVALAVQGGTVVATPRLLLPAYTLGAGLATTPAFAALVKDPVNGAILVLPGNFFAMQGVTAPGTAPLVMLGASWKEVQAS